MGNLVSSLGIYLHLPILLVLVSMVYTATRFDDWEEIIHHGVRGCGYILTFLGSVFLVLMVLSLLLPLVF